MEIDGYIYRSIDEPFLEQLCIMQRESRQVYSNLQVLSTAVLPGGIRFFRAGGELLNIPPEVTQWGVHVIERFLYEALGQIACFGFVAFCVDHGGMSVTVIEPMRLRIMMRRSLHGPVEYCVTMRDDYRAGARVGYHDPEIFFFVMRDFDWATGKCTGRLSQCIYEYLATCVLLRNELVVNTGNTHPVYVMEHTDTKSVHGFMGAVTPVVNDFDMSIPGHHVSAQDRLDARARIAETIHFDDKKIATDMSKLTAPVLPSLQTDMKFQDFSMPAATFVPAGIGRKAHQRIPVRENRIFPTNLVLLNQIIADAFQVPCRLSSHVGEHRIEALDSENQRLYETGRMYFPVIQTVLDVVSEELLDVVAVKKIFKNYVDMRKGRTNPDFPDVVTQLLKNAGGPVRMVLGTTLDMRRAVQLFDNWFLTWDKMKDIMMRAGYGSSASFEVEDPRVRISELGGPGRKGESTIGQETHDTQRGTRGYTSDRVPAKPGNK